MERFHEPVGPTEPVRFTVCPVHQTRETGQNYLGRVTAFFGCRTPKEFCRDYDLNLRAIHHGEPDALRHFAGMTGADADELIRWTPRRVSRHLMMLNGVMLDTKINPRSVIHICPRCAMDAIAANPGAPVDQVVIGRAEWTAAVVDVCLEHGVALISHRGPQLDVPRLDPGYQTSLLLDKLDRFQPVHTTIDDFQLYVLSRLGIVAPKPSALLDGISVEAITQICHAAGLDLMRYRGHTGHVTGKDRRAAGFDLLGHGSQQFEQNLLEMRQGMRVGQRARSVLPRLLEHLAKYRLYDSQCAPLISNVVDIVFRNLPYSKGELLLGRSCPTRTLHDFTSAIAAYRIGQHHLRAFLAGMPALSAQTFQRPQDALIRVDIADRLFIGRTPFVSAADVVRKLGRRPHLATSDLATFAEAGITCPEEGSISNQELPVYSEVAVDAALTAFVNRCQIITEEASDLRSPSQISAALGLPYAQLWKLISSGRVGQLYKLRGASLVDGLRVRLNAVLTAITDLQNPMTATEAAEFLETDKRTILILVARRWLTAAEINEGWQTNPFLIFDRQAVKAFRDLYVSAREVRRLLAINVNAGTLCAMGLTPAFHVPKRGGCSGATFFFRHSVLAKAKLL